MRVVILGAGYGGIRLAIELERRLHRGPWKGQVVLVDQSPLHQLVTEMHQVAAGSVLSDFAAVPLARILGGKRVAFRQATVTWFDLASHRVRTTRGPHLRCAGPGAGRGGGLFRPPRAAHSGASPTRGWYSDDAAGKHRSGPTPGGGVPVLEGSCQRRETADACHRGGRDDGRGNGWATGGRGSRMEKRVRPVGGCDSGDAGRSAGAALAGDAPADRGLCGLGASAERRDDQAQNGDLPCRAWRSWSGEYARWGDSISPGVRRGDPCRDADLGRGSARSVNRGNLRVASGSQGTGRRERIPAGAGA